MTECTPSRRAMMRGAAWATPTVAIAVTAPAIAASIFEIIAASTSVRYQSTIFGTASYTITNNSVTVQSAQAPATYKMVVYVDAKIGLNKNSTWSGNSTTWSKPKYLGTENGFTKWEIAYTGNWSSQDDRWTPTNPSFTYSIAAATRQSDIQVRIVRTATSANGVSDTTDSDYLVLQSSNARRSSKSQQNSEEIDVQSTL